jgi:hypothetical protein
MSKYFNVQINFEATVYARIEAETDAEAKGLAEKFSLYESTVLLGIGSEYAETITTEQEISVFDIQEYTTPDQFQPERLEPLNLKLLERLKYILETEVGEWSSNYDWQEHWELSDEEFEQIKSAVELITLKNEEEGAA